MKRSKKRIGIYGGLKAVYQCPDCCYFEPDESFYMKSKNTERFNNETNFYFDKS
jgi:hypothetical protein